MFWIMNVLALWVLSVAISNQVFKSVVTLFAKFTKQELYDFQLLDFFPCFKINKSVILGGNSLLSNKKYSYTHFISCSYFLFTIA